jgi:glycosyltransferase involved in cell wall biosynthesis
LKGKCGLKALTSMASGAPVVLSPVGVNATIVQDGVSGLLARTEDEWVAAISRLVEDAALRERMGAAARDAVVQRYSVTRWAPDLVQLIKTAAN